MKFRRKNSKNANSSDQIISVYSEYYFYSLSPLTSVGDISSVWVYRFSNKILYTLGIRDYMTQVVPILRNDFI
jgi:hypothetical protein